MTAVGTAAIGSLRRSVEAVGRAEEKRLTTIRTAFLKAIAAHSRELDRALSGKNDISPRAYEHWHEVNDKLRYGLHTVEMCIQEQWKRERCPAFDPIGELLDYASGLQRARATAEAMTSIAERYLAQRAKANERDRRYRERKRERERRLKLPKPDTPLSLTSLLCEQDGEPAPRPSPSCR